MGQSLRAYAMSTDHPPCIGPNCQHDPLFQKCPHFGITTKSCYEVERNLEHAEPALRELWENHHTKMAKISETMEQNKLVSNI